eukprot:TRINITY_DN68057_c0_g1_i1.p1 TRINITY_DN68057_c0_g1~~TRINITY_DN68057_c0_g1_i1.p1  ORF type:complete len:173 (+),score=11.71 TRINITY_DN68057_c0_g1_i1:29-520(+)
MSRLGPLPDISETTALPPSGRKVNADQADLLADIASASQSLGVVMKGGGDVSKMLMDGIRPKFQTPLPRSSPAVSGPRTATANPKDADLLKAKFRDYSGAAASASSAAAVTEQKEQPASESPTRNGASSAGASDAQLLDTEGAETSEPAAPTTSTDVPAAAPV